MHCQHARLLRHLTGAVLIKLVMLCALWWAFVRPAEAPVGSDQAAAHLLAAPGAGSPPPTAEQETSR